MQLQSVDPYSLRRLDDKEARNLIRSAVMVIEKISHWTRRYGILGDREAPQPTIAQGRGWV